jgi:pyruvate,orthophosphate dikinase
MIQSIEKSGAAPLEHAPDPCLYGGKGASLMTMAAMGIPVPMGFILPIGYEKTLAHGDDHIRSTFPPSSAHPSPLPPDIERALTGLEEKLGYGLGNPDRPLFLSVRSGGAISMPGMMDTFLNIGLIPKTCPALAQRLGLPLAQTESLYQQQLATWENSWNALPKSSHQEVTSPDPKIHLWKAIQAVWHSWNSPRALAYRQHHNLQNDGGSAVIIQVMVFGNAAGRSGTGVLFTRRPDTGENTLFGEFLPHAQGEDLVSGAVTPQPLSDLSAYAPKIFEELSHYARTLEQAQNDMQDIEFTFEKDTLWILQTRSGKRTANATFRMAYDRVMAGESTREQSLISIDPMTIDALLYPHLTEPHELNPIARGLATSPGAAIGRLTVDPESVTPDSILLRSETSAEDVPAMLMAKGVVTLRGGMTSHAAVIMRSIGKPCISGLENATITPQGLEVNGSAFPIGTTVTMDGTAGLLFNGQGTIETPSFSFQTTQVLSWADEMRSLTVYANADTPEDIMRAITWGADGIGLCRTEHMMFESQRLRLIQQFILAPTADWRNHALLELEKWHQQDLWALLRAANSKRLIVRLLDPPLHEFLPTSQEEKSLLAVHWDQSLQDIEQRIEQRSETNPMMGQRGCRLGLAFPELYIMQIRALFGAMDQAVADGLSPDCGVMIPLVSHVKELETLRTLFDSLDPGLRRVDFGVMIETPRAALIADALAPWVDFISFGTNDLTQMTWGISRDDSHPITQTYQSLGITDPFYTLDTMGVGQLMQWACTRAKTVNPNIAISVCGEHAANPGNIGFFHRTGIGAVSCSPWALPRVRLAAAKAVLSHDGS